MASLANHVVIGFLRLMQLKRLQTSARILQAVVRFQRKRVPGILPERFRQRYRVSEERVNGDAVYTIAPKTGASGRHVLYLHGGAYLFDILSFHWRFIAEMVDMLDCTVTVPLYPLAPERQCRDAFDMTLQVYRSLIATIDPKSLAIMGDSAGGGLTLAVAQGAQREGLAQPGRILLLSPWLDVSMVNPDIAALAPRDPLLTWQAAIAVGQLYAGDLSVTDPRVSPLYGGLEDLAPIHLFTGRRDILNADARLLRDRAISQAQALTFHEEPEMMHAWMLLPTPEGRAARAAIIALVSSLEGGQPSILQNRQNPL